MSQSRSYKNVVSLSVLTEVYSIISVFFLFFFPTANDCADCRGFPPDCSCENYFFCKSQGCDTGECQPDCPGIEMFLCGALPYEQVRDVRRKIKPLKKTNLGLTRVLFDP